MLTIVVVIICVGIVFATWPYRPSKPAKPANDQSGNHPDFNVDPGEKVWQSKDGKRRIRKDKERASTFVIKGRRNRGGWKEVGRISYSDPKETQAMVRAFIRADESRQKGRGQNANG